jgi:murein DD-endopeptidase MepM/ murein hydrolase activator NlpD
MAWQLPFPDKLVTGDFGKVRTFKGAPSNPHRGTDWAPKGNTIIPAIASGTIKMIQWSDILGWVVVQSAWWAGKTYYIGYCHLQCDSHGINCKGPKKLGDHSPLVSTKVGDKKELGEPVGRVGTSGSASNGAHLHATLSKTLKGVFYGTVYDLRAFIKATAEKPAESKPEPKKIEKAVKTPPVVYACPHCKKELK